MMATENLTVTGTQPKSFEELICSPSFADGLKQHASYLSTVNFLLSLTAFLGNSLILVALHKESSLHPPSKLLYRCLATTDLLIGLATQPLYTIHWISLVREDWVLCRFAFDTAFILGYQLGIVSLLTLTAIGVDRRAVFRATIQTNCSFKAHVYRRSHLLGCFWCRCFTLHSRL